MNINLISLYPPLAHNYCQPIALIQISWMKILSFQLYKFKSDFTGWC